MTVSDARRWRCLAVLIAMAGVVLDAHHSIAGVYDSQRRVTLEGVVAEFHFVNPHPFVIANVAGPDGQAGAWRLELDNRYELVREGMTAGTLQSGDRIVVIGSPARDGSRGAYVRRLDRASDGFRYEQVGNSPRIRPPS